MPERCPLLDSPLGLPFIDVKIPEICRTQCQDKIDAAVSGPPIGDYDFYLDGPLHYDDSCKHEGGIEFSHDGLIASSAIERIYSIVDLCVECQQEYGEWSYKFDCSNT